MASKYNRPSVDVSKIPPSFLQKWGGATPLYEEGFLVLPKKILRILPTLFKGEATNKITALFTIIDFHRGGIINATNDYLAYVAGLSEEDFLGAIKELIMDGYLENVDDPKDLEDPTQRANYNFTPFIEKALKLTTEETKSVKQPS